ncbi:MAG: RNA polymerase-binding protein DksA [Comamonadaceae bacterium]|nr:MAG: RNA polymerase-binding protein DksA [Comamonadaceae bacterium]
MTAAAKTSAKPAAKPAVKTKTASKTADRPVKPAVKPAAAAAKKPATSAVPDKVVKSAAETAKKTAVSLPAKTGSKASSKTAAKSPAKAAPHVAAKPVSTPSSHTPAVKPVKEAKAESVTKTATKAQVPATAPAPVPATAPRQTLLPAPPPLKPGRRSSARTATHSPPPAPMVPTHAPDAAKASYSTMTERVIAPPPHVAAKKDPKLANNWKDKSGDQLSDDEVKAMPDAEYMNDKQLAFFRHKLSILKQDIHNSAGETTEHLREDTVVVPDPADRATIEEEHALELRTRDRERKLLKKIEQSIARIDSGDYGYCDETGEPIGVGRLIARPTANLSLEAQQRRELKQKMFGD